MKRAPVPAAPANAPDTKYPGATGGLFIGCIGLGVLVGSLVARNAIDSHVFGAALILAVASSVVARRWGHQRAMSRTQRTALFGSIAFELLLFVLASWWMQKHGVHDPRTVSLVTLLIVGIHFLPMAFAFGPRVAWLGVVCSLVAALGLAWTAPPFLVFGIADGSLKIALGLLLFVQGWQRRVSASSVP